MTQRRRSYSLLPMMLLLLSNAVADPPTAQPATCSALTADLELPLADWTRQASSVLEVDSTCTGIRCEFVVTRVLKGDTRAGDRIDHLIFQGTANTSVGTGRLLVWGDVLDTAMPEDAGPSRTFLLLDPEFGTVLRRHAVDGIQNAWYGHHGPVGSLAGEDRHGVSCRVREGLYQYNRQFELAYFGGATPQDLGALQEVRLQLMALVTTIPAWNLMVDSLARPSAPGASDEQ